ncbi:putative 34-dihydroxy-2-butanone 4-phosphate synthase protein [Eutypa lata UCREL1]|uniref:Putative 34-dihydroxy-2-butanone 4-phosphate synthase protein n=1 Tax=Eutypa lata (strain UCR-EL1) TaxID=1287681 RepID=M7SUW8_EUTLA|nr:putative 34-dihydroxy-2-butanone 4-phosphate synthase protein [Eutypa lata UCREL1]
MSLDLGEIEWAHFDIIPARYDGGLHNAPRKQFVWWISGMVHFTLPNATGEAWIYGGKHGIIFGDDTADSSEWGHGTAYPGGDETIALTIPTRNNTVPEHTVLHDGACEWQDLIGI